MIVVTGAEGFIASAFVARLNQEGYQHLVLVDRFDREDRRANWEGRAYRLRLTRQELPAWLEAHHDQVEAVVHLGARTDTTEFDRELLNELNTAYTKTLWTICQQRQIAFLYASSAATYGGGELGYKDDEETTRALKPLNPYGQSKQDFDVWTLDQADKPYFWAGFKFFNVYGPGEYHKGRMASVVMHAHRQIRQSGSLNLFKSHRSDYTDGGQMRDFIYVRDVADVLFWTLDQRKRSGLFNLGSGRAETFDSLGKAVFDSMGRPHNVTYIDMPEDIRDKYQYFTQADMSSLRQAGYDRPFTSLVDGVREYVSEYLEQGDRLL